MTAPCKSAKLAPAVYTQYYTGIAHVRFAVVPFTLLTSLWHISAFPINHSHNAIALCGKPLLVVQQRPWTLKQAIDTLFMSNRRAGATCCTTATRGYKARQCAATPHAHCVLSKATSR